MFQYTMKVSCLSLLSLIAFMGCDGPSQKDQATSSKSELIVQGESLLKKNCYSCHNPETAHDERLAPPFFAIKKHYLKDHPEKAAFTEAMLEFMQNPSNEKAKMKDAVERFGLMPKMPFEDEQIRKMAEYIYQAEFSKPKGGRKHRKTKGSEMSPLERGKSMAMKTKKVLGKNLMQAINEKGTVGALSFCSTKAIQLTDSMGEELKASIKRVSDKNRNPANEASASELAYIAESKTRLASGKDPKPQLLEKGDRYIGYYPIISNQMCLQCHGKKDSDITIETQSKIAELYPKDKAFGYQSNEIRGIWVVEMQKKN